MAGPRRGLARLLVAAAASLTILAGSLALVGSRPVALPPAGAADELADAEAAYQSAVDAQQEAGA